MAHKSRGAECDAKAKADPFHRHIVSRVKLSLDTAPLPVSPRDQEWILFDLNQAAYLTRPR